LAGAVVAAVATLPGLGAGTLWDNSETAYGEVAREVALSNDWIVLHFNGHPWYVQPPLYFWLAAILARLFGDGELAFRLPSALATIAMGAAVGYVVGRLAKARAAVLASVALSTSLMQVVVGRLAIMDALLDLMVALAILAWFGSLRTGGARWWYGGWVALALGTLAKGPVAPVVVLLVVAPWVVWESRVGGRLFLPSLVRWALGAAVYVAIVAPWALALGERAGPIAFDEMVGHYTVGRYLGTIENQSGPVWYYMPVVILGFFPWVAYLAPALSAGWRAAFERGPEASRSASLARLALVWAIVPFVFFSLAKTKLPNYIALELPSLAILVGLWFDAAIAAADRRVALWWTALVPVTLGALAVAITIFSRDNKLGPDVLTLRAPLIALGVSQVAGSLLCFALLVRRKTAPAGPFALAASSVAVMSIIALVGVPLAERFKPIPHLAAIIERERRPGDVVAVQGINGGNALVFYTRPGVVGIDQPGHLVDGPNSDPRRTICAAERAFVVTSAKRPDPDPTYGRRRTALAYDGKDVLFLYDGPPCGATS
jgi:4-amino-4-deoxy-L-arabinose transferase-like glycosyltransferase